MRKPGASQIQQAPPLPFFLTAVRFSLKQALLGLTAACAWLTIYTLAGGVWALLLLNGLVFIALCIAAVTRPQRAIVWVLPLQTFLLLCLGVLVASYHINGRAWHDYGGNWNPPPSHHDDGTTYLGDYDPKFTRPFVWPWIGDVMAILSLSAIASMIIPPTAPLCPFVLFMLLRPHSAYPKAIRVAAWIEIAVASVLVIYLACWGTNVADWLAD